MALQSAYLKYITNITVSIVAIVCINVTVLNLDDCMTISHVACALFLAVEVLCNYTGINKSIFGPQDKAAWKVSSASMCAMELLGSLLTIHGVLVLFGAPVMRAVSETVSLTLMLTVLCCARPFAALGPHAIHSLLSARGASTSKSLSFECEMRVICVVFGTWAGALPIPLDWDTPWQAWPLTCTTGALLGEAAASLCLLRRHAARR